MALLRGGSRVELRRDFEEQGMSEMLASLTHARDTLAFTVEELDTYYEVCASAADTHAKLRQTTHSHAGHILYFMVAD